MPEETTPIDAELNALLDRVCGTYHLASREDAAEFLLKRRLRRHARGVTGRGRALYPVRGGR